MISRSINKRILALNRSANIFHGRESPPSLETITPSTATATMNKSCLFMTRTKSSSLAQTQTKTRAMSTACAASAAASLFTRRSIDRNNNNCNNNNHNNNSNTKINSMNGISRSSEKIWRRRRTFVSASKPFMFAKAKGKAAAAAGKGEGKAGSSKSDNDQGMSTTHVTGANYFKEGEDPKILPDDQYPSWLFDLAKAPLKISDYEKRKEEFCAINGEESEWGDAFTWEEMRKWRKLVRRATIKANNESRARK